jgi:serine/threonine protein kinase
VQPENPGLSEAGKEFVRLATTFNAELRPSVHDLLQHPWITMHCKRPAAQALKLRQASFRHMHSISARLTEQEASWTSIAQGTTALSEVKPKRSQSSARLSNTT